MRTLYCSLVRPLLEYSCQTWNPYTKRNIIKIYFFNNRIVGEWNSLPNHIRESNCIETFKKNVLSFIKDN